MTHTEQAIRDAIKGGYKRVPMPMTMINEAPPDKPASFRHEYNWEVILWDPLFWKALGKTRGWNEEKDNAGETFGDGKWHQTYTLNSWFYNWHRLIDHLATQRPINEFFKELK